MRMNIPNGNYTFVFVLIAGVFLATLSVIHNILIGNGHNENWLSAEIWNSAKMFFATIIGYFIGRKKK